MTSKDRIHSDTKNSKKDYHISPNLIFDFRMIPIDKYIVVKDKKNDKKTRRKILIAK